MTKIKVEYENIVTVLLYCCLLAMAAIAVGVIIVTVTDHGDEVSSLRWAVEGSAPPATLQPCTDDTIPGCTEAFELSRIVQTYATAPLEVCDCRTMMQCAYRDDGGFLCVR